MAKGEIGLSEALRLIGWWKEDDTEDKRNGDRKRLLRYLQRRSARKGAQVVWDARRTGGKQAAWRTSEGALRRNCPELFDDFDMTALLFRRIVELEKKVRILEGIVDDLDAA